MYDLLGILALGKEPDRSVERRLAPLSSEAHTRTVPRQIDHARLTARFLAHGVGTASYAAQGDKHLFVVGEIYPRGKRGTGPLPASDVLLSAERDRERLLAETKGNFALVLLDVSSASCELIASRLAISPFYYTLDDSCLVFSTGLSSLLATLSRARAIDPAGVAELAVFNYPLGQRTYVRDVKMLQAAELVRADANGMRVERWWDVRSLYALPRLPAADALELGGELLHNSVNDLARDVGRVRVSFTSGFDSRAILALLEKPSADVLTYAFGIQGSLNVSIPLALSKRLGIQFDPIYLGHEYEERFDENALRAVELSDCLSTLERANYPYAFERNAEFSPVVLTGLFGSELLRTFQNIGHIVSGDLVRVHLSTDPRATVQELVDQPRDGRYFGDRVLREGLDDVQEDVARTLTERFGDLSPDRRFYMFLLSEGLRKYFGGETHMERPWGRNRFPFLDEEFVEFAFQSPFAGVHSRTLTPTVGNRFRSQYFYADVIRRYRPELLHAPTDHGYAPGDLLAPFPLLKIGPSVLLHRFRQRRTDYREFNTEQWTAQFYQRHLFHKAPSNTLFAPQFAGDFSSGRWLEHRLEFARAASLKLWIERRDDRLCLP